MGWNVMRSTLFLLAIFAAQVLASDSQIDTLQAALQVCRQQTANANAWAQEQIAALAQQLSAAQKRIAELEAAKEPTKK